MAYDAGHDQVILYGGRSKSGVILGDTWSWNGTAWTALAPANSPPPLQSLRMDYDPTMSPPSIVLFGGTGPLGRSNATWTWDGTDWTQQHPVHVPQARSSEALAYDGSTNATGGEVLMWGSPKVTLNDTWAWDGTDWLRQIPANPPPGRGSPGMAYSPLLNGVVLYGGKGTGNVYYNETYLWNGTDWALLPMYGPSARYGLRLDYDALADGVNPGLVMFGGVDGSVLLNDTWILDAVGWRQVFPAMFPTPRCCVGLATNPGGGNKLVLFGGSTTGSAFGDTWLWDGTNWSCVAGGCPPVLTVTGGPTGVTNATTATFTFSSNKPGSFKCSIEGASYQTCTSPQVLSGLVDGQHTFSVFTRDNTGLYSNVYTDTWTVDTIPPVTTISSGPSDPTTDTSATFTFSAADATSVTFSCSLDGGASESCVSGVTYDGLAVGPHTFSVTGTDGAGNVGAPATWSWTINPP